MRLALACLTLLAALPASAQLEGRQDGIRVGYEYGLGVVGDLFDFSGSGGADDGFAGGVHQAYSVSVPLELLNVDSPLSLRVAWVTVQEDRGSRRLFSFPGVYLAATPSLGGAVGFTMDFAAGYDLYNKEGMLWLTWFPTVIGGIGPHLEVGPVRIEALFGGQFTSLAQGGATYGKLSVAVGV